MQCAPCRQRNIDRDGGQNGLCWQHRRTRCALCQSKSYGLEFCTDCRFKVDKTRAYASNNFKISPAELEYRNSLDEETLRQARYQAYSAVDSLFRILTLSVQRIQEFQKARSEDDNQMEFPFSNAA